MNTDMPPQTAPADEMANLRGLAEHYRALSERYRTLLEAIPDILCETDAHGICTWANPAAREFFGDDMIGKEAGQSCAGLPVDSENWQTRQDGQQRLLAWRCRRLVDEAGRPAGALSSARDVTERRLAGNDFQRSQANLARAQAVSHTGSWYFNAGCDVLDCSEETHRIFALPRDTAIDIQRFLACVHPQDRPAVLAAWSDALAGFPFDVEHRILADDGERWVRQRAELHFDADGELRAATGTVQDVSERKHAENKLRQAAIVFASVREGISITDRDGRIVTANPAFTEITGYAEAEIVGKTMGILKSDHHDPGFYKTLWHEVLSKGHWHGEIWNRRKNGETYAQWLSISTVWDARGAPMNYVGVFTDISPLKHSEARLEHLAHHDALTDLPNRRQLMSRLSHALERARRNATIGAVLFLDLDRFKTVNDTLGHHAGDELLRIVAQRLRERLRDADTLARLGGDEFVAILEDLQDPLFAANVAQDLIDLLNAPFHLSRGQDVRIGGSIGVCLFPDNGVSADLLIQHADAALYRAKACGRNAYRFYSAEQSELANRRLVMEGELQRALQRNELVLHYQPLLSLADAGITGVEALVRWRHPVDGLLGPSQFISLAEEGELSVPLGEWILREACAQLKRWLDAGLSLRTVAVNLSPRQFKRADLCERVRAILAETGLPAHHLELEFTERALMEHRHDAEKQLAALGALGVRLAIDDFGTGYSCLATLKRLRLDKLKIDPSFVHGVGRDPKDAEIAATIVGMARTLNFDVLAEGIETQAQLEFMQRQGCTGGQGHLFCRPMPASEVDATALESLYRRCRARVFAVARRTDSPEPIVQRT